MRVALLAFGLLGAGCYPRPVWLDQCPCGDNLCVQQGTDYECMVVPDACALAYVGECQANALEPECGEALCGNLGGDWELALECHKRGSRVYRLGRCVGGDLPATDTGS